MKQFEVNQKGLSKVLKLTARQVYNLGEKGLPSTVSDDGSRLYDLTIAVPWYVQHKVETTKSTEKQEAETRKKQAEASMAELELAERLGTLVPLETVHELLGPVLDDVRAKVLRAAVVTVILAVVGIVGLRSYLGLSFRDAYTADQALVEMHNLSRDSIQAPASSG